MKYSGAQIVAKALKEENVTHSFGIPGTHNIELYDELRNLEDLNLVLVTDEQCASFMADGLARSAGGFGVVNVVPGAGLTHALSGIAEAYMDQVPLLVLGCGIRRDTGAAYQLHDVDQCAIAQPVCKKVFLPRTHKELYHAIKEACFLAKRPPCGPTFVEVPANLYFFKENLEEDDFKFQNPGPHTMPQQEVVDQIVKQLNESQNIAFYVGMGAAHCQKELIELAEYLDALVYTTISGKGVFPENHVRWVWNTMGNALPKEMKALEKDLDCLVAIGCRFGEVATASYGFKPPKNLIHIDVDASVFNKNYPASLTLEADAKEALQAIQGHRDLKEQLTKTLRLNELAHAHHDIREQQARSSKNPERVSMHQLLNAFQNEFGDQTIFVTDSGNGCFYAMEELRLKLPRHFLGPIDYSCMGYSVPAAIGAKMGHPDKPVVALVGDGAFLMTGMELVTAKANGVGAVFCILNDGELSQIAQFQRKSLNRETLTQLNPISYEALAQATGVEYLCLENSSQIPEVLRKAHELSKEHLPILLEAKVDYESTTFFSKGVVKTNFLRFPWKDRVRLAGRMIKRKLF